jgi:hypothetical protein|tara:strand:+ start:11363 stop:11908 length:546 start_codon:yes stop_codon:yes gene_type:complete
MIIAGNKNYGVAEALAKIYPDAKYCSRTSGYNFEKRDDVETFVKESCSHNEIILVSALWKFQQTLLLEKVFKENNNAKLTPLIIVLGSTADRYHKASAWLYSTEKKALREYADSLGKCGIHSKSPKVSLISFCTLSNKQDKHDGRVCMDIDRAVGYIKWIVDQPRDLCINEISIDMIQDVN